MAVLSAGPGAALAGLTAARLDRLAGFDEPRTYLLAPAPSCVRIRLANVVVHRSRTLRPDDIHPARTPPRTRLTRSLLDAAAWAPSTALARGILAAGVQQRLVRADQLAAAVAARPSIRRHALIAATLGNISEGAQALSELDFTLLLRRHRIPEPDRQVMRLDSMGRRRWLNTYWDQARLAAEIDGMWHMEPLSWWADMCRDNELTTSGYRVLRFPAFALREAPDTVATQIKAALRLGSG
ncbi:MAG TPA: DUF559 domain-containing protein [Streptosporangiaceae bacterium]|nr:DUF559 domain-containing protein [Streptosporangiaceae bacterium]